MRILPSAAHPPPGTARAGHGASQEYEVDPGYWPRALTLRVVIAAAYVALVPAGLLPMSAAWWVASGWGLLAYSLALLVLYTRAGSVSALHLDVAPFADTALVTLAIVALARPDYPIWAGYFLVITSLSMLHSTRYMLAFAVFTAAAFLVGLWVLDVTDRAAVQWPIGAVVAIMTVFVAVNCDVVSTSNRKLRQMVHRAALTDPLTGLDNRRRFRQVLESHGATDRRPLAVLMYDIDNFKDLNERLGHVTADEILVRVADELRSLFRDADTVARFGGDELIVLAHVAGVDDAVAMGERSIAAVAAAAAVWLSVGVSVYPQTSETLDAAVRAADHALGQAKRAGKARVHASVPDVA